MFKKIILFLIKNRINYLIKKAFEEAEYNLRRNAGNAKINFATEYICKKTLMLPCFKKFVKEVLINEFDNYSDYINRMIIREAIVI